jgi:oligopeptide/dipeptide ABC transporter ATP-binding protein
MRRTRHLRTLLSTASGRAGAVGLVVLVFLALFAPSIWGDAAAETNTDAILQGPSRGHLAGTDGLGRDVLARVLVATRPSLGYALLATACAAILGIVVGLLPAVLGRRAARAVSESINMLIAFPGLILALFVAVVFGVGAKGAVVALGVAGAPSLARLTNTLASSVAGSDYVAAARVLGVSRPRLLRRHVLPNIAEPLVLNVTTTIGSALLAFSALSFLGLGLQAPQYDWGRMLSEGLERIYTNPAAALAPGVAIVIAGLTFSLLGEGLAQASSGRPVAAAPKQPQRSTRRRAFTAEAPSAVDVDGDLVLDVRDLVVTFPSAAGDIRAVRGVSLAVRRGEIVGIVGESGSGKTVTALAIAQLVSRPGQVSYGRLSFDGREVGDLSAGERRRLLATSLPMVFQNPGTTLNPALRVGRQLAEVSEVHDGRTRTEAMQRAVEKLRQVAIAAPDRRVRAYPHELSGGMKQRAVIAMGLMGNPKLYIADEPTTALDVTVQRQIFDLLRRVNAEERASVMLISHDIAAVAELCTRIVVMYAGRIVEEADVATVLEGAAHPYTRALVAAVPDMSADRAVALATIPGRPPDPRELDAGCPFAPRCPHADDRCRAELPTLDPLADGWRAACWHPRVGDSDPVIGAEVWR